VQSLNALYCEGLVTGTVFESGEGLSACVPVVDGYLVHHAIQRLDVGGRDVNEKLMELLSIKKVYF